MAAAAVAASARRLESHSSGEADWKKQRSLAASPTVLAAISNARSHRPLYRRILRGFIGTRLSGARELVVALL
jgi:hypothetical protein